MEELAVRMVSIPTLATVHLVILVEIVKLVNNYEKSSHDYKFTMIYGCFP
jgi:hypothetical protein